MGEISDKYRGATDVLIPAKKIDSCNDYDDITEEKEEVTNKVEEIEGGGGREGHKESG